MTDEQQPGDLLVYRLALAEKHIETQNERIDRLRADLEAIRKEEEEREKKRLLWGISSLGAVIMALGTIIWNYRSVIFR